MHYINPKSPPKFSGFYELGQPLYSQAQVLELTGISAADLQDWVNRGIVRPQVTHPNEAAGGHYTTCDIYALYGAAKLMTVGVKPHLAANTAFYAQQLVFDGQAKEKGDFVVVGGWHPPIQFFTQEELVRLSYNGVGPMIVINWAKLTNEICDKIGAAHARRRPPASRVAGSAPNKAAGSGRTSRRKSKN